MPTSKDDSKPRKVIDVTEPGKSEPSASSRPIIVTNRPILQQDPMVVSNDGGENDIENIPAGKAQKPESDPTSYQEGHAITPPSAPQVPTDSVKADETPSDSDSIPEPPESTNKSSAEAAEEKNTAKIPNAVTTEVPATKVSEAVAIPVNKEPSKVAAPEPKEATPSPETSEEKPSDSTGDDQLAPNKVMDEAAKKAQEEKAAKEAEQEKIIESKKYFLPINAVQHRRNKFRTIFLFLIVIFLAVALLDFSLDAGLLKINGVQPLTHFFSSPT